MPMAIHLPVPTVAEVEEFKRLYRARFGIELSDQKALEEATRLVQYVFLVQHAMPRLKRLSAEPSQTADSVQGSGGA